jgi:riboflavin synthase
MFTGLIQDVGKVIEASPRRGSTRLGISCSLPVAEMQDGESIAVDGVCLSLTGRRGNRFYADVVAETLALTTLGKARPGRKVNLERSLSIGDKLGGHLVQGHVDDTARVVEVLKKGDDYRIRIELTDAITRYIALKGSVALNGVSLTISDLAFDRFEVAVVPHTLAHTTLGTLRVGEAVNVEVDLLARYLERMIGMSGGYPAAATDD